MKERIFLNAFNISLLWFRHSERSRLPCKRMGGILKDRMMRIIIIMIFKLNVSESSDEMEEGTPASEYGSSADRRAYESDGFTHGVRSSARTTSLVASTVASGESFVSWKIFRGAHFSVAVIRRGNARHFIHERHIAEIICLQR